jgi:peptide/nickel transport system substrate-binding protein
METGYWQTIMTQRARRRKVLAASAAFSASALMLAACGGSDSKSESSKDISSLITPPKDETKSAKAGGIMKAAVVSVTPNLDPHLANGGGAGAPVSRLFRVKPGVLKNTSGEIEGDLVESWEVSPDRLTITAKMNPNAHFAPIAPANGREVDAEDVVFSWNRHKTLPSGRTDYWTDVNPNAPIASITAVDKRTLAIKLTRPTATVLGLLSRDFAGDFHILPKEPGIDFKQIFPGSGPFYFTKHDTATGYTLKKNPGYKQDKIAGAPWIDEVQQPVISENSQQVAQLRAGATYIYPGNMRPEDILQTKRDIGALEMVPNTNLSSRVERFGFGMAPGSPFLDERVRQAFNMTLDRQLLLEVGGGAEIYTKGGLPWEYRLESGLENGFPGWDGWILDPKDEKAFGPNAANYKFDVARAKQLMSAAGHPNGIDVEMHTVGNLGTFAFFAVALDSIVEMVRSSGVFRAKRDAVNDQPLFLQTYQSQQQRPFEGVSVSLSVSVAGSEPSNYLFYYYNQAGSRRQGTDATLTDLTNKAIAEFDAEKRKALVHETQKYEGKVLFFPRIGAVSSYTIAWPILRNRGVYTGGLLGANVGWGFNATNWLDTTKPPEGKS